MTEFLGVLVAMGDYLFKMVGPGAPVMLLLAVQITGTGMQALLDGMRGRKPEDVEWVVARLSAEGGLAQLAGILGTVCGIGGFYKTILTGGEIGNEFLHAILPTAVGIGLSMIAEAINTYVLLRRRTA